MLKSPLTYLGLGLALLVGLFVWLRPAAPVVAPAAAQIEVASNEPAAPSVAVEPGPPVYRIVVSQGRRVSGPEQIQVHAGDTVTLEITSDHADELHLHGYDLHLKLLAGEPQRLSFIASHSGRFDYELHHADLELGAVEVLPQ